MHELTRLHEQPVGTNFEHEGWSAWPHAETAMKESTLYIDGIAITVTRKRMKTVRLKVKPPQGDVFISAPFHVSDAEPVSYTHLTLPTILRV